MTEEIKRKISKSNKGKPAWNKGLTKETSPSMRRVSEKMSGDRSPTKKLEVRMKMSQAKKGKKLSKEHCKSLSLASTGKNNPFYGKKHTEESKRKMSIAQSGKNSSVYGRKHTKEEKLLISQQITKLWKVEKYVKNVIKGVVKKPNNAEVKLDTMLQHNFPNEYKYVGDGQFIIDKKCPDFINCNGQKKVIELFGTYWHGEKITNMTNVEAEQQRINTFKKFGFKTLIIWENELYDESKLVKKLENFNVR